VTINNKFYKRSTPQYYMSLRKKLATGTICLASLLASQKISAQDCEDFYKSKRNAKQNFVDMVIGTGGKDTILYTNNKVQVKLEKSKKPGSGKYGIWFNRHTKETDSVNNFEKPFEEVYGLNKNEAGKAVLDLNILTKEHGWNAREKYSLESKADYSKEVLDCYKDKLINLKDSLKNLPRKNYKKISPKIQREIVACSKEIREWEENLYVDEKNAGRITSFDSEIEQESKLYKFQKGKKEMIVARVYFKEDLSRGKFGQTKDVINETGKTIERYLEDYIVGKQFKQSPKFEIFNVRGIKPAKVEGNVWGAEVIVTDAPYFKKLIEFVPSYNSLIKKLK
jgi:hypothetical protein